MKTHNTVALVFCLTLSASAQAESFRIAAASSLQFALDEVVEMYANYSGMQVPAVVYGSSGNLYLPQTIPYSRIDI